MSNATAMHVAHRTATPARFVSPRLLPGATPGSTRAAGTGGRRKAPASHRSSRAASRGSRIGHRLVNLFLSLTLAGCFLIFMFLAVGPHILGYRTATMLTGSMEPGVSPGDVIVQVERPTSDLQVGDVLTYGIPVEDHRIETHRVTEIVPNADGSIDIRTRGDNNANIDPWVATIDSDTVWVMEGVVPELGNVIRTVRTPVIQEFGLWAGIGGVILLGFGQIWAKSDDEENDES